MPPATSQRVIRILYLDDDPSDIAIFESILGLLDPLGYIVTSVRSLTQARAAIERENFDILIADYRLDQTDGVASTELILEVLQRSRYLPILLVSAHTSIPIDQQLLPHLNSGRLRFIDKDSLTLENMEQEIRTQVYRRYSVLIVDDDADDRELLADCFTGSTLHKFDLYEAASLEEAEAQRALHPCDIYLIDWHLGPDRGVPLVEEISSNEPNSCVVLVTGRAREEIPAVILRLVGRRRICFASKSDIETRSFENFVMHHLNRLVGTSYTTV